MEKICEEYSTERLEQILKGHMTGAQAYSGNEILAVCKALAERTSLKIDAAGIYRHYLEVFLPEEIKKDL